MLAAVDLGSNSFHMVVARQVAGRLHIVDRIKERVALGEGLDDERNLSNEAIERGLVCLQRFAERLKALPPGQVRVVGTNTLRQAKNGREFMKRARTTLGHGVEIISGREEARLVYLGVARAESHPQGRRLVVDIGGGSTECVLGRDLRVLRAESLYMGCISYSRRFFPDGKITQKRMSRAINAAKAEMQTFSASFRQRGWDAVLGSSGTILAVHRMLREGGAVPAGGITPQGLAWLRDKLVSMGRFDKLALKGLEPERAPVICGGVAVLCGVVDSLGIARMEPSTGALREGLLHDLLGRIEHHDVRDETVSQFAERFHVDEAQATRVAKLSRVFFQQAKVPWELEDEDAQMLAWAARLHEIGLSLQYSGYHKHGSYLVLNSDMPGFSRNDQETLAAILWSHRRRIKRSLFRPLGPGAERALRLAVILRLAVTLNRGRAAELPRPRLELRKHRVRLSFPPGTLEQSPLTQLDLDAERELLEAVDITLVVE